MRYGFLSVLLLFVFAGEGLSQNYRSLPGAGAAWQFVEYNTGSLNPPYWRYYYLQTPDIASDTIIANTTYHKLIKTEQYQTGYWGCYRSESNGKTWFVPAQDTIEQLIIDLNVQPGDTLFDIYIINRFQNSNPQYVVIDSVGVFQSGITPLKMVFASYETGYLYREPLLWIESFGAMQGFANQVHDGWSTWIPMCVSFGDSTRYEQACSLCYEDSTFMLPRNFAPMQGECQLTALQITGIAEPEFTDQLLFYPNPATHTLSLEPTTNEPQQFRITNASGQLVLSQNIQGRSTIDVSHLPEGLYIAELETPQGTVHQKLILQR